MLTCGLDVSHCHNCQQEVQSNVFVVYTISCQYEVKRGLNCGILLSLRPVQLLHCDITNCLMEVLPCMNSNGYTLCYLSNFIHARVNFTLSCTSQCRWCQVVFIVSLKQAEHFLRVCDYSLAAQQGQGKAAQAHARAQLNGTFSFHLVSGKVTLFCILNKK